jgi:hypothetical protein
MKETKMEPVLSRKSLLNILDDRAEVTQFLQSKPYSCVVVRSFYNDREYLGYGFSKVSYPDKWEPEQGAEIAKHRALIMVLHQVRATEKVARMNVVLEGIEF